MTTPRPGPDTIKEELLNQTLLTESHWAGEDLSCYTEQAASTQETVAVIHTILFQSCHSVTRRHCGRLSKSNFLKPKKAQCVCERTLTVFLLVYSDGTYHCFVQFWPLQDNILGLCFFTCAFKNRKDARLIFTGEPKHPTQEGYSCHWHSVPTGCCHTWGWECRSISKSTASLSYLDQYSIRNTADTAPIRLPLFHSLLPSLVNKTLRHLRSSSNSFPTLI